MNRASRQTAPILIVDDEPDLCDLLQVTLQRMGHTAEIAHNLAQARTLLARQSFSLCLCDLRLPDGAGTDLLADIQRLSPAPPCAVITAHGSIEAAVEALKLGAFDFVNKPVELPQLKQLVGNALRLPPAQAGQPEQQARQLIGASAAMAAVRARIAKVARSQAPVLIQGPSGTGKELAARLIHDLGPRAGGPFVPVNCGAIPEQLLESEFFGHVKGAFTGATQDKEGLLQTADGGTLFLDEIADLPLHMQVKLLRVIQEKAFRPVGATVEQPVNIRYLSATHQDLQTRVAASTFRQDLYYRLNVIDLLLPPLVQRQEDIPLLATHLLAKQAQEHQLPQPTLTQEALAKLQHYHFPGNVRELENILTRAAALCENGIIQPDDIELEQATPVTADNDAAQSQGEQIAERRTANELTEELENLERQRIEAELARHKYNKTATARTLGLTLRQLRYRLKKLGLS